MDQLIELVGVLSNVDLGDLRENLTLTGTVRVHFHADAEGVELSLHLPEPLIVDLGDAFAFSAESRDGLPLVELLIEPDGELVFTTSIGEITARVDAIVADEDAPEGQRVDVVWGGFDAIFAGTDGGLDFSFDRDPLLLSFTGGGVEDYEVSTEILNDEVSGAIRLDGEIERNFEADLEGYETTYAMPESLRTVTEHNGVRAVSTFSSDARIVNVLHASSLRRAFFKAAARTRFAFAGDVERIDSILCVARGRYEVALDDAEPLVIDDESDDRCIVGYFTKDDDVLELNYTTMFD